VKRHLRLTVAIACLLALGASWTLRQTPASAQGDDPQRWLYEDKAAYAELSGSARSAVDFRFAPPREGGDGSLLGDGEAAGFEGLAPLGNVLVNDPTTDTIRDVQSETTMVLGARGTVVSAFNDSGSLVPSTSGHFDGFSRSADFGASWTDRGHVGNRAFGSAGDPVLARDNATGRMYLATLYFRGSGINVFRSSDDGLTFGAPVNAMPGFQQASGGLDFLDKEWIAVDNVPGPGQGNVYVVARNFSAGGGAAARAGITFARSTNGGQSYGPSPGMLLAAGGQGGWVVVGADHAVYVFWFDSSAVPSRLSVRKSTDQGVTFGPRITVAPLLSTGVNGDMGLEFRTNTFLQAVANPVDPNLLYAVFNDNPVGSDRGDIYLTQSFDAGATWSPAVRVNDDPTSRDQWQPSLAVTPNGTHLFVGFYDRRLSVTNTLIDVWGTIGTISGPSVTFGRNFRITTASFPPVPGGSSVNPAYMGDYDQAVADGELFYYTWGDNRLPNPNDPVGRPRQPDVRFVGIPVSGPTPASALTAAASAVTGGNGNAMIDPNECSGFTVTLQNFGPGAAMSVSAALATTTPGVTITQATAAYPDIPPGESATSVAPFQLSTSPEFRCGVTIGLTLTVTVADGTFTFPLSLRTGSLGPTTRFDNNGPLPIPEVGTVESPVTVSGISEALAKVRVSLHLDHTFDGDLRIALVAPDNTVAFVALNRGGAGDNYGTACSPDNGRTTFDDDAVTPVATGLAPFVGTFKPDQALAAFNGKVGSAVNGTWKLRIIDDFFGDSGNVNCWSLLLTAATCPDGGGQCLLRTETEHVSIDSANARRFVHRPEFAFAQTLFGDWWKGGRQSTLLPHRAGIGAAGKR
jgi:subtilisin-like proprotein convertase family protein